MGLAGMASGASDALQALLVQGRAEALQLEQLALQQAAAKRAEEEQRQRTIDAEADRADRAGQRKLQQAQIAYGLMTPGEITPEQAGQLEGTPYGGMVEKGASLASFGIAPDGARTENAGGTPWTVLQPNQAQAKDAAQQRAKRRVVELFQRGAPRPELLSAMTDAGQEIRPADLVDPRETDERNHQQRLAEIEAQRRAAAASRVGPQPEYEWVMRGGEPVQIRRGSAQPGDRPYDAVAQRQAQPGGAEDARAITQTAYDLATRLLTHEGIDAATGAYELRGFTQPAVDFNSIRGQLVAALALPNLGALKGPMSDKDILFVKQLATRLENPRLSKAETLLAINEAKMFLEGKGALPATPQQPGQPQPARAGGAGPTGGGVQRWTRDANGRPVRAQ